MPKSRKKLLSRKKIFYVYALLDTRKPGKHKYGRWSFDFEPFYIGKGKANRANSHIQGLDTANKFKCHVIARIRKAGLEPRALTKRRNLTEKQALMLEEFLISAVGRRDLKLGPLTNLTDGGEGGVNYGPYVRQKMSNSAKLRMSGLSEQEMRARVAKIEATKLAAGTHERVAELTRNQMASMSKKDMAARVAKIEATKNAKKAAGLWVTYVVTEETRAKLRSLATKQMAARSPIDKELHALKSSSKFRELSVRTQAKRISQVLTLDKRGKEYKELVAKWC